MRLYWVRHGQMEIPSSARRNVDEVNRFFSQQTGRGLSPLGREQARRVALRFRAEPLDAIYSSPLARARETADVTAAELGLEVAERPELGELSTGALRSGSPESKIVAAIADAGFLSEGARKALLGGTAIPLYYWSWRLGRTEGGESREELHDRLGRVFDELRGRFPDDARVALFAHGYLLFHMVRHLAHRGGLRRAVWRRPYIPHGAITEMELGPRGRPTLVRYAASDHLD